jgi:outer membrane protein assembly factor BamB
MQDVNKDGVYDGRDWRVYQMRRTSTNAAMAVRLDGKGDVTETHVLWRYQKSLPDVPGGTVVPGCVVPDPERRDTADAGSGDGRDEEAGTAARSALDEYYASPVAGDGKVYLISRNGKVTVLEAGANWGVHSSGDFGEEVFATPAIADGHMWVRTATALYDFAAN